jgi:hypothetical protein
MAVIKLWPCLERAVLTTSAGMFTGVKLPSFPS